MKKIESLPCEACGTDAAPLYQRDTDGLFVCVPCVPQSTWNNYPGARERADLRDRRAQQARANFGREKAEAVNA